MSIVLKDVHRAFGPNQVLRGLDLEVLDGETLSIIGFSGPGMMGKGMAVQKGEQN